MADNPPKHAKVIGAPKQGTPEAEAMIASLERAMAKVDAKIAGEMVPLDEMREYATQKGLNGLMSKIRKEQGDQRLFTRSPEAAQKKPKKKRMRVAI